MSTCRMLSEVRQSIIKKTIEVVHNLTCEIDNIPQSQ